LEEENPKHALERRMGELHFKSGYFGYEKISLLSKDCNPMWSSL